MVDHEDRPEDDPGRDAVEGVRIIGAAEAAEAVERGDVAGRLSEHKPGRGDQGPPSGARPALRFPLDLDSDPADLLRGGGGDDTGEPSGTVELPHWTDPPTGEVPAVLAGDDEDDLDAWSSFASSSPTRWRGADDDWEDTGEYTAALFEDAEPLGALDQSDRPTDDDLFSFDDLDEIVSRRAAESGPARTRTAASDPHLFTGDQDPTLEDFDDGPLFVDEEFDDDPEPEPERERPARRARRAPRGGHPGVGAVARGADDGVGGGRDVPTAVAAGVGIAVVTLICFALGPAVVAVLVMVVVALAAVEYFGATQRAGLRPAALLGLVATIAFPLATYWRGEPAVPVMLTLVLIFTLLWYLAGAGGDSPVLEGVGSTIAGVLWIGLLASFATLMLRVPDGRGILLAIIITTVLYDIGAFFVGRSLGRRALSTASPNKSVEGVLGGLVAAMVAGAVVGGVGLGLPFHGIGHGLILGVAVAVAATLGDLSESLIKRDLGVKDMGSLIPGHGGILDRVDGLLFVLPVVYYLIVGLHWM